jgi:chromosome segregation ATPase
MNLQFIISCFLEKREDLYFEYHDIDGKTVTNCMDHFMTGIRNEMAKTTRLLNIQKNKAFEHLKNIEEKKKEIEELKNPKFNTPTQTTPEVSTNNTKVDTEPTEKIVKKSKLKKVITHLLIQEDKIEIIKQLEKTLRENFEQIDQLSSEINQYKAENKDLEDMANEKKLEFSTKYSEIYSLEMKLDKMKSKLNQFLKPK